MSAAPDPIRKALYDRLAADEALTALATGGIHHSEAPAATVAPYAVFRRQSEVPVWSMRNFFRDQLWLVKGLCRGSDAAGAEAIDARCEELLNDAALAIEGAVLMYLRRESAMPPLTSVDNGEVIYQAGGLYRLRAEP